MTNWSCTLVSTGVQQVNSRLCFLPRWPRIYSPVLAHNLLAGLLQGVMVCPRASRDTREVAAATSPNNAAAVRPRQAEPAG